MLNARIAGGVCRCTAQAPVVCAAVVWGNLLKQNSLFLMASALAGTALALGATWAFGSRPAPWLVPALIVAVAGAKRGVSPLVWRSAE